MIKKTDRHRKNQNKLTRSKLSYATGLLISSVILGLPVSTRAGEVIVYPGAPLDTINGMADSLGPSGSSTGKSNSISGNSVTVNSGGHVGGSVYGAININDTDAITGNAVTINSGSTINWYVYGGRSTDGDATSNTVTMSGGSVAWDVYGGLTSSGKAAANSVNISGGTVGSVYGGLTDNGDVIGNTVTISAGTINQEVFGGRSNFGNATGNSVVISGGTIGNFVYGGWSFSGNATDNSVTISGGAIDRGVMVGFSWDGDITNNTLTLSGGTIAGGVYGGFDYDPYSSPNDVFTGNTLYVKAANLSVGGDLKNFEYLNFYLPSTTVANTTMLTVGGEANLTDGAGRSSKVNLGIAGGSAPLKVGDTIILIDAGTLTAYSGLNTTKGIQGISLVYDFDIIADTVNNKLLATVSSVPVVNPQTKVLSEGRIAGLAFVTQGTDMLTGTAMQAKLDDASYGSGLFGLIQGSGVRHDTGSHVDVDGMNLVVGAIKRNIFNINHLTAGAFVEAGWGNYDSYNSFINASVVHSDGSTNYYGVGLLGKLELPNDFYADGSLRIGRVETDFKAYISGLSAQYDSESTYTSASIGGGKIFNLDEQNSIDLYARYLWTRVGSDSQIVVGDRFNFEAMNSHRIRTGLRYTHDFKDTSSLYAGAAYEYEFDGDAKASVHFQPLHTPSLQGGSGVFELGVSLKPQGNDRLSFDIGAQGYVGQREGVTGTVRINYAF